MVVASVTRSPWYLGLALLCIGLGLRFAPQETDVAPIPLSPLHFGLVVVPVAALVNAAFSHLGDSVLLRLPDAIPLFGGPITWEALMFGGLNGLKLTVIYGAFVMLNRALPVRSLVRLIPRAFYQVSVVVSIAVTYVPTTLRQFQQIREAQAVRGHRLRGWRDWLPLFMPLLVGGMERALQLAEAMIARGFASGEGRVHDVGTRLVILQGLVAVLAGWVLRVFFGWQGVGLALMIAGALLIVAALWLVGRRVPHTTYRQDRWGRWDTVVVLGVMAPALMFLAPLPGLARASIFFYPYPAVAWPGFEPWVALSVLGLLLPAVMGVRQKTQRKGSK
jgi:energy-coupling factor transport system permease protein